MFSPYESRTEADERTWETRTLRFNEVPAERAAWWQWRPWEASAPENTSSSYFVSFTGTEENGEEESSCCPPLTWAEVNAVNTLCKAGRSVVFVVRKLALAKRPT